MAEDRSLLRLGDGASAADVTGRCHGGQGATLEQNGQEPWACSALLSRRILLAIR